MKKEIENKIEPMSVVLNAISSTFLACHFKEMEDTSGLINLVISSHISSMCNTIMELSSENKEMIPVVDNFIKELLLRISDIPPIKGVKFWLTINE